MKSWIKKTVLGLGVIGMVAGISACGHHTPEERQAKFVSKMVNKLDLTEAQTPYAENLVKEFAELKQEMKLVRQQQAPILKNLIASDTMSAEELQEVFDAPKQVFDNHREDIINQLVALHSVLNTEQKQELAEKIEKMQKHFDDH